VFLADDVIGFEDLMRNYYPGSLLPRQTER
jgi:hypothetical protein